MRSPHAARNYLLIALPVILILVITAVARQLVQADGRINQIAHFGGDALYCVDGDMKPTDQLPTTDPKGFRLLNQDGQVLWYVPGHDVEAALKRSVVGGDWELIAEGNGTYGPVSLHTYNVGGPNGIYYVFIGYDEHGKTNSLTFQSCMVGPLADKPTNPPIPTGSLGPSPTNGPSPTASDTSTPGPSPTASDTATWTSTPTSSDTATWTSTPTSSNTATWTSTPTSSDTATATATDTEVPS